jgi:hypothetical protein
LGDNAEDILQGLGKRLEQDLVEVILQLIVEEVLLAIVNRSWLEVKVSLVLLEVMGLG